MERILKEAKIPIYEIINEDFGFWILLKR